jgi:hypothetical protein
MAPPPAAAVFAESADCVDEIIPALPAGITGLHVSPTTP